VSRVLPKAENLGDYKSMKNLSSTIISIFLLISLFALLGCNAPLTAAPTSTAAPTNTVAPTEDPQILASTISAARTEAVATAYAQLTEDVTLTPPATDTPQATETTAPTPIPPSLTPTRIIVLAPTFTVVPTQGKYQCSITSLEPKYGATLNAEDDFDLAVTLKNIGTEDWSSNDIDFRYISGEKFQKKVDALDLQEDVDTGDSVDLVVDMTAPSDTGVKNATWGLVFGSTNFCPVTIHVTIK
jgi:hypothetical protein